MGVVARDVAEIVLDEVWKIYPDGTEAVHALGLGIADGEFMVLVGPSGCGKTTALRMVAGLEVISRGTITIGDTVVNNVPPKERDIAMVFQNYALYPHMTVFDNMAFGLKLQKIPKTEIDARVRDAANILDLSELLGRKPAALSGGQRQRVAMGRAIVRHPQAFLMDEPLSNLDAKLRVQMRSEIARIQHDLKVTTIYVTHDQTEAMTMGDRVAVIRKGMLQQVNEPQTLYDHPVNLFVAGFIGSPAMNLMEARIAGSDGRLDVEVGRFRLPIPDELLAQRPALRGLRRSPRGARRAPRGHGRRHARVGCTGRAAHPRRGRAARGARLRRRRALRPRRTTGHHGGRPRAGRRRRARGLAEAGGIERPHGRPGQAEPPHDGANRRADRARRRHPSPALLRSRHRVWRSMRRSLTSSNTKEKQMRKQWLLVPVMALGLLAAACGSDKKAEGGAATTAGATTTAAGGGATTTAAGGGATTTAAGGGGSTIAPGKNTGKVTLLSAGEPEEVAAYQKIFDDLINSKTDYKAEVVSAGDFEQQFQIQAAGGTLDVAAAPQPGAIPALVDKGEIVALEDLGFNIDELNKLVGESFVALGEYKGKHYGVPTNINLKSMIWYPKKAFDAKGYKVPTTWDELLALSDKIVADGSTPWCVGFGSEGVHGLARHRLDGRHHAPHRGARGLRQVGQARDPLHRSGRAEGR